LVSQIGLGVNLSPKQLLGSFRALQKELGIDITWKHKNVSRMDPRAFRLFLEDLKMSSFDMQKLVAPLLNESSVKDELGTSLTFPVKDLAAFYRQYGENYGAKVSSIISFYKLLFKFNSRAMIVSLEEVDVRETVGKGTQTVYVFRELENAAKRQGFSGIPESLEYLDLWLGQTGDLMGRLEYGFEELLQIAIA
jgi:hypothetical protein